MAKKPVKYFRTRVPRQQGLDNVPDASGTVHSDIEKEKPSEYGRTFEAGPNFPKKEGFLKNISLVVKIAISVGTFFVVVVVPTIWFAAKLHGDVDNLKDDTKESKEKIEKLVESSVKQENRLDNLEKNLDSLKYPQAKKSWR